LEQGRSLDLNTFSPIQEINRFSQNRNVHYSVKNSPSRALT